MNPQYRNDVKFVGRRITSHALILIGFVVATSFAFRAMTKESSSLVRTAEAAKSTPKYALQKIERIRVGQRVIADDPNVDVPKATRVNSTWRRLRLMAAIETEGRANCIHVETLQSPEWVTYHRAAVGNLVPLPLDLVEMGLPKDLLAEVVANGPCPSIGDGPGRVVLTTVNQVGNDVWQLNVADKHANREVINPTGRHRFYSLDRSGWIATEDLRLNEKVRGLCGQVLSIIDTKPIPELHHVYNMTIEGEHVFFVSPLGALTHNNGCGTYKIDDGVRRSKAAQLNKQGTITAKIKRPGQPDELAEIPIEDLRSPKSELPIDLRLQDIFDMTKKAPVGPDNAIEVVPMSKEIPGLIPIEDVQLVPPTPFGIPN